MCKVLNICTNDWANFAYDNYQSLLAVGVDAKAIKFRPHKNSYPDQCEIVTNDNLIQSMVDDADVIQVFFSDEKIIPYLRGKKVIVYHAGSNYRNYPEHYNKVWNPIVDKTVLALGEFWNLGAKNQNYLVGAIDTNRLQPNYDIHDKTQLAHYPSNVRKKGTNIIFGLIRMLSKRHSFDFKAFNVRLVSAQENIKRISDCDVYIELYQPVLDGKPYGSWGITAMEAAALGKIVITNHISYKVYESVYGNCGIMRANTIPELEQAIKRCLTIPRDKLLSWQYDTRNWIESNHSYKATGEKLIKLYGL